ncbi:MAG: copper amine oxidase N-terminal domain-containing protein [Rubrobacteridae bacterium]|nr:copper amine oxidase N-terminal domain-containing protein [Rubrobacteridae bacterium]
MKRLLLLATMVYIAVFSCICTANAATNEVMVKVNDIAITPEIPPFTVSGRVMVPLRSMSDALGARTAWNGIDRSVTVFKSGRKVTVKVGNINATLDDSATSNLGVPPMLIDGVVLIPARFISEALGARVEWNSKTSTMLVSLKDDRDGMTAQVLYDKAISALINAKTYKYSGTGQLSGTVKPSIMGSDVLSYSIEMNGVYRSPKETYSKTILNSNPSTSDEENGASSQEKPQVTESYSDGESVYTKYSSLGWVKSSTGTAASLASNQTVQDPTGVVEQLKNVTHTAIYGDDVLVEGRPNYSIIIKPDSYGLKDYILSEIMKIMTEVIPTESANEQELKDMRALLEEYINQYLRNIRMDLTYKLYVDKETLTLSGISTSTSFKYWAEGLGTSTAKIDSSIDISGMNEPVEMPDVKSMVRQ